ncbi:hypothetical protein ACFL5Q_05650, partial [Planctomycetota bacterium]
MINMEQPGQFPEVVRAEGRAACGQRHQGRRRESESETSSADDSPVASKGHGRNGADAYRGAEKIDVPHETLRPGGGRCRGDGDCLREGRDARFGQAQITPPAGSGSAPLVPRLGGLHGSGIPTL